MAYSREAVLLLHPTPQTVRFADTVSVRYERGVEISESLKNAAFQKSPQISRRKFAFDDIKSPGSTRVFDSADSEDDEIRIYMETVPCDRDL